MVIDCSPDAGAAAIRVLIFEPPEFRFTLRNPDIFLFNKKNWQNQREPPRPREDLL